MPAKTIEEEPRTARYPEQLDELVDDVAATAVDQEPDQVRIARRANQIWRLKGCPEGTAEADWFEAEQQLKELYR